jgi:hypothetical protein
MQVLIFRTFTHVEFSALAHNFIYSTYILNLFRYFATILQYTMHDKNLFQSYTQDSRIADVEDLLTRACVLGSALDSYGGT